MHSHSITRNAIGVHKLELAASRTLQRPTDLASALVTPLILSKLKPPRMANTVARKKLLALLDGRARKVVTLVAPTGSGKSTLLNQWYRASRTRPLAWLSLDKQDDHPVRLFAYLNAAIHNAVGCVDAGSVNSPARGAHAAPELMAAALIDRMEYIEQPLAIVLDDFHHIADPEVTRLFLYVVRRSPAQVRWIISGRGLPALNLSELTLQDELLTIDAAALAFDCDDIVNLSRKLSTDVRRAPLTTDEADRLLASTEGWAAGVKLALLSQAAWPESNFDTNDSAPFSGSHCEVVRYLTATVLQQQSSDVREFLLASSMVERLNGDLCNELLGIRHGQSILESLEAAQLFIRPLDGKRHWYGYHPLFRQFLRACLQRDCADKLPALHLAASHWYAEHQLNDAALQHAFETRDRAWCIELIARCARAWLKNGEIAPVLRWTGKLTRQEILQHDAIASAYIASLIFCRRFTEANDMLRAAEHLSVAQADNSRALQSRLQTLRLMLGILSDATGELDCEDELPGESTGDKYLTGTLMALQAYWLVRRGRFAAAKLRALRARDLLKQQGSVYGVGYADVVICIADRAVGDLDAVAGICERLYASVKNGNRNPAWVNAATALANLRYEQNRLSEAEALCVEILPLLSNASTVENLASLYVTLARIYAATCRPAEALRLLDYLHSVLEGGQQRRFLAAICYEKIRLHLALDNDQRANAIAMDFDLVGLATRGTWDAPQDYDAGWERFGLARAALLLRGQSFAECRDLLNVLVATTQKIGYVYRTVPLQALLAVCEWQAENRTAAFEALNRGWALTRQFGFTRSVFDEAPALHEILTAAIRDRKLQTPLPPKYLDKFHNVFVGRVSTTHGTHSLAKSTLQHEPLTDREIDMLRLLAQGLSNQEIATHSQIALSTAKWHLKNVFAKLAVTTRTGAIARARDLQLIE